MKNTATKTGLIGEYKQQDGWHLYGTFDSVAEANEWRQRVHESGGHHHLRRTRRVKLAGGTWDRAVEAEETIEYARMIGNTRYTFTAHATMAAARRSIHPAHSPLLVVISEQGEIWYDAYPLGHPLPADARPLERCQNGEWCPVL